MKKYELIVYTQIEDMVFYTESDKKNPIIGNNVFTATGSAELVVSRSPMMTDKFRLMISPDKCSLIEIRELEESECDTK